MKESFSVRRLQKEDAGLVGDLFRAVYGEEYPAAYVYNPEELWVENQKGNTYSVLAFNGEGKAVGHLAIYRSAPSPRVYEAGQLLVIPEYRGSDAATQLIKYLNEVLVKEIKVDVLFSESVCNHRFTQRNAIRSGYLDTALEIDLMPAETYEKEQSSTGRVACLLQFKEENFHCQRVYLPSCYYSELVFFYERLFTRGIEEADTSLFPTGETVGQEKSYDFAGVARIAVEKVGADFSTYVQGLEKMAQEKKIQAMQVYLPLTDAAVGEAVSILRKNGFFLGGILPCWFGGDALLMQKLWTGSPNFSEISLYTAKAKKMLELIRADWERSRGEQPS